MASAITLSDSAKKRLFHLFSTNQDQLAHWLDKTLERAAAAKFQIASDPIVLPSNADVQDNKAELCQLCEMTADAGYALYSWSDSPPNVSHAVSAFLNLLGLHNGDAGVITESCGLSLLQDATGTAKGRFPPYQPKAMNWHTDGYYNTPADRVRCFSLHCIEPAAEGGALLLLDDALLILALLHEDPNMVTLLSHPEAMTLPHNRDNQGHDRPDRSVPLIQQNSDGSLSMRFTTRSQNIRWRCQSTKDAAIRASELISSHTQWQTRTLLKKGQGIITRNVLHAREAFVDAPGQPNRQVLRGRFNVLPSLLPRSKTACSTGINKENLHVAR